MNFTGSNAVSVVIKHVSQDEGEKTFELGSEDAEVLASWLAAVKRVVSSKPLKVFPESFKEGYLHEKRNSSLGGWSKRFPVFRLVFETAVLSNCSLALIGMLC